MTDDVSRASRKRRAFTTAVSEIKRSAEIKGAPRGDWIDAVILDASEITNRTNPADWRLVLMVSGEDLRVLINRHAPRSESTRCEWLLDTDGIYHTSCGHDLCYDEPLEDCGVKFCQCCGKEVRHEW